MNLITQVGKSKNEALDSIADQMDDVAVEGLSVDGLTSYFFSISRQIYYVSGT